MLTSKKRLSVKRLPGMDDKEWKQRRDLLPVWLRRMAQTLWMRQSP